MACVQCAGRHGNSACGLAGGYGINGCAHVAVCHTEASRTKK